ncbi:MAG: FkbM family methyltransferase, partial [Cyclobacteriaceae bacterium]|nr:FkbM family methyltransferase [Cyclobacteriaceae bacterium]
RKLLKPIFLLSIYINRWTKRSVGSKEEKLVVSNFDSNLKLMIDRSRSMGASIFWTGFHEYREFLFLNKFLKEDMVGVDVGANLGEYTLFMAKRLRKGRIFSFEPLENIRTQLIANIKLNDFKQVEVFGYGLSDRKEQMEIHEIDNPHEGLATTYLGSRKSKATFLIQLDSLDSVFPTFNTSRIDFLKLDIEGGELKALQGGQSTIGRFRPYVMIEINEETYQAAGYSTAAIAAFFRQLNYLPFKVNKMGRLESCPHLPVFGNIIYVPQ